MSCACLPEALLESELFGHARGAFTGAVASRQGKFEYASSGTLFLDEIGELSAAVQVKLLRVLQEQVFERVGDNRSIRTTSRIITATNRDLSAEVKRGTFRADLFYRISTFPIVIPPLRQRPEDVAHLVDHIMGRVLTRMKAAARSWSPEALAALSEYEWPGNVRELQNVVERVLILEESDRVTLRTLRRALPDALGCKPPVPDLDDYAESLRAFDTGFISRALRESKGNVAEVVRRTRIPRRSLYEKMAALSIDVESFR